MPSNPFLAAPSDRLADWKHFRRHLSTIDFDQQLAQVAAYWSHAPIGPLAYNPEDASQWLTPWELLHNNQWCRSSVAIGMDSTLRLAGISPDRLNLSLLVDIVVGSLLVVIVDDIYALNYDWGSVRRLPLRGHKIIREWRFVDRGYSQLDI